MDLKLIKSLCQMNEQKTYKFMYNFLSQYYRKVVESGDCIFAEGELPICLVAHMDTVFVHKPTEFLFDQEAKVLWSPHGSGFDDKIGLYIIIQLIEDGFRPSVILTTGEELGCVGARNLVAEQKKCPFKDCRAIIQLDRANRNDAVFYGCDNKEFEEYICSHGFNFAEGTYTDISILAPSWGIAAVNLSVGYVDEHMSSERLYMNWTKETIDKVTNILYDCESIPKYNYVKKKGYPNIKKKNSVCDFCGRLILSSERSNILNIPGENGRPDDNYVICDDCMRLYTY